MTIQSESEEKKILQLIVAASEEFLQYAGSKLNYQKMTDNILYISGAKYAGFNLYDEDGSEFRTVAFSAPKGIVKKASSLFGFKFLGKSWEHDPVRAWKIKLSTITHFSSLSELGGGLIYKLMASLLEKTFNFGEVAVVKILKENIMLGDFTLIMPRDTKLKNDNYVEVYTRQVGLLIVRSRSEARLIESEKQLRSVFAAVSDPLFILDQKTGAIQNVNDAACSLYGYARDEMFKLKNTDMSAEPEKTRKALKESLTFARVRYHKKKDGTVFPVEITSSLFELNGRKLSIVSIRDITERKKAEEALRKSEEKFSKAFHSGAVLMAISSAEEGRYLEVNDAFLETLGFKREEVIGKTSTDLDLFVDKGQRAAIKKIFDEKGKISDVEVLVKGRDGIIHTAIFTVDPIDVAEMPCWLTTMTEITERKRAEENLKNKTETLQNVIEGANAGTWEWNVQTGETVFNERWAGIIGYTLKELEPTSVKTRQRFAHPDDFAKSEELLKKHFQRDPEYYFFESRMRHKDGSWVWVAERGKVIEWDKDDKPLKMFGTCIDITEHKRVEETLKESKKTTESYLNVAAEIIVSLDTLGNITLINDKGHQLLGYTHDELIGKNWFKTCLPRKMISDVSSVFEKLMNGDIENVTSYENQVKTKSGEIKTILWHNSLLKDSGGNIIGTISSGEDITDRKKAEEEIIFLSFHDHLTGLYNRRFFEEELKRLDTERQLPLSFVMGDLNGLKLINDVFGHAEGDKLLKETAEILKRVCRSDDILARWGGDEFVLLLPHTLVSDTEEIIERIKKECKKTKRQKISISFSLGTAIKETAAQDIQTIVIDAENNMYKNKLVEKESLTSSIIFALKQALYEKSNESKEHTDRIHDLAVKLGKSIKLSSRQFDELSLLVSLHDIGKVAIPETILLKKGKLTEKEWKVIKRHPEIGFNIAQSSSQIAHIAKPILYCHENWEGSGYPFGINGESIPIISRIIFIVDAYDVMTSGRAYKLAMSREDAITELKRCAGSQFDPVLVDKFIEVLAD